MDATTITINCEQHFAQASWTDSVLSYMPKHEEDLPLTASAIGKGIDRSSDAVVNCLARPTKAKQVRQ